MCARTSLAQSSQTDCGATDPADSGTHVSSGCRVYLVTIWRTLMGHPALPVMGVMADTLRATLRDLAHADARLYRGLADITATAPQPPALPATQADIEAAIALLEAHGYTVTR